MNALTGDEVRAETTVIRTNDEWVQHIRQLRYDGNRYQTVSRLEVAGERLQHTEQDHGLFALVGASS